MRGRLSSLKYVDKGQLYEATILKSLKKDPPHCSPGIPQSLHYECGV